MAIRTTKAQKINGMEFPAGIAIIGLDKRIEALAAEGGGATPVNLAVFEVNSSGQPVDANGNVVSGGGKTVALNVLQTGEGVRASIQAALDGGDCKVVVGGDPGMSYPQSAPLKVDDYTRLVIDADLQWPAGMSFGAVAQRAMVENRHSHAARQEVNVTSVGNIATIVSRDGSPLRIATGQAGMICGSAVRGYNGVYEVTLVNPTTATVKLKGVPAGPTAIANTYYNAIEFAPANQHIHISGKGTLDGNDPIYHPAVDDRPTMGIIFCGVRESSIRGLRIINSQGYAITVAGVCGVTIAGNYIDNKQRDGIHWQGCTFDLTIEGNRITSLDDAISGTTGDYAWGNELVDGDWDNVKVLGNHVNVPITGACVALFGKTRHPVGDLTVQGLRASCAGGAVHIKSYTDGLPARYQLDRVVFVGTLTIGDIALTNWTGENNYASLLMITGDPTLKKVYIDGAEIKGETTQFGRLITAQRVTRNWSIDELRIRRFRTYRQGNQPYTYFETGVSIGLLVIEDSSPYIRDYGTAFALTGATIGKVELLGVNGDFGDGASLVGAEGGSIGALRLERCDPLALRTAGSGYLVYSSGTAFGEITIKDTAFSGAAMVLGGPAMNVTAGHKIRLAGNTLSGSARAVSLTKGCAIMTDQQIELGVGAVTYDLGGAGQVYSLQEGLLDSERTAPISFSGGATVNLAAPNRRIAVTTAGLNRFTGGALFNTNAAAGTLAQAGPVICQGTAANSWKLQADTTKAY